jgi:hypothetical protein
MVTKVHSTRSYPGSGLAVMLHRWMLVLVFAMGADWKDRSFPNWDDDTVLRLLTDSPWAKAKTVPFIWEKREERPLTYKDVPGADRGNPIPTGAGSPVGGIGGGVPKSHLPDRADLIVRWSSALPVRHAKALYRQRDEKLNADRINELIGVPDQDYIVEIFGVPAVVAHQGTGSVESVARQSAWLKTKSGRTLRPNRVEATVHGLELKILIHFSRTNPIQPIDRELEFFADFQIFKLSEKFKLSQMMYQNHLEL